MGIFDTYRPEEAAHLASGDHKVKIVKAEYKYSSNNKEMVSLELVTVDNCKLFMSVTEGEFFNKIMTNFYDGFKIPRGDSQIEKWVGRTATAHIDLGKPKNNGNRYMEVKYFLAPVAPTAMDAYKKPVPGPAANGQGNGYQKAPQARQPVQDREYQTQPALAEGVPPDFPDDIPF